MISLRKAVKIFINSDKKKMLSKCKMIIKQYGFPGLKVAISNKMNGKEALTGLAFPDRIANAENINRHNEIGNQIIDSQQKEYSVEEIEKIIGNFEHHPLISIIMPVYNAPVKWLERAIESLQNQYYKNWELCAVDDGSSDRRCVDYLSGIAKAESRIRLRKENENRGISYASNLALNDCRGSYIALLDQDDELTPDALFWVVRSILTYPESDMIYSDECKIDTANPPHRSDFYFKPDWSPTLLINHMYVGHLTVYRAETVRAVGGFRSEFDFSQDYDLALRVSDVTKNIYHIERVLYYWRMLPTSGASGGKDFARVNNMLALADWFKRKQLDAKMQLNTYANYGCTIRKNLPLVSIIIPTDSYEYLKSTLMGIMQSTYSNVEVIPVTNSKLAAEIEEEFKYMSDLKLCKYDKVYNFSDKCNCGAKIATGEILLFYNDDVVPCYPDWIERLLEILMLPGVGGVSPILLHKDHTIQYAGMICGTPGIVGTAFNGIPFDSPVGSPYHHRLLRDVSVLCGACTAISRNLFFEIGGFDSRNTPSGHSDLDISLKILEKGLRNVCTPYAVLIHMGNHSWDSKKKQSKADIFCLKRWGKYLERDPYFTDSMKKIYYMDFIYTHKIYVPQKSPVIKPNAKDILILTHQLTRTGAPIILKELVKVILDNNDYPVLLSPEDGPLKEEFLDMGCTVIIDESMANGHWMFEHFAKNFDLVVANTLGCSSAIKALSDSLPPVLWWIHEGEYAFRHFKALIPEKVGNNIKIYASIGYVFQLLKKHNLPVQPDIYEYGVLNDFPNTKAEEQIPSEGNIFAVVGTIERRKGQDVLLDAIEYLPESYRKKAKFVFVGNILEADVFDKMQEQMADNPNIEYWPVVPLKTVIELFKKSNCVVIPSRDDPLPVVATEAMMLERACICSDHTGTASLLEDKISGLIFHSENAKELSELLIYAIDHVEEVKNIGKRGRRVYEDVFSYEEFKKRTNNIFAKMLS